MTTTANIINIIAAPKETLISAIKRAIKNAQCNNQTVRLVYAFGVTAIVNQDDTYKTHLTAMKLKVCQQELKELRG